MFCYLKREQLPPLLLLALFMSAFEQEYKSSHPNILFPFILTLDVMVSAAKVS